MVLSKNKFYAKMILAALFLVLSLNILATSYAAQTQSPKNMTILQSLSYMNNKMNSRTFAFQSFFHSLRLANLASILNDPATNSTLFVPTDSSLFDNEAKACPIRVQSSSSVTQSASITIHEPFFINYMEYHVAHGTAAQNNIAQGMPLETYLSSANLVKLPNQSNQFVIVEETKMIESASSPTTKNASSKSSTATSTSTASAANSKMVSDGLWPPAQIVSEIQASNGWLYVIDRPLIIPKPLDQALVANNLDTFKSAMERAGLLKSTSDAAGVTIFVDCTWSTMKNSQSIESLIVDSVLYTSNMKNATLQTKGTSPVNISTNAQTGKIFVNGTAITRPNILLQNGVMHVIGDARKCSRLRCFAISQSWSTSDEDIFSTDSQNFA